MEKLLLSGNEAIALGAFEAGARLGSGYPGTPSTEILEALTGYPGVYTEWSVNEKVALEVGLGAAFAGGRALVTMKHVGLNVAADPLFTASYTGVKGGLVVVSADDPGMHSSQNEQDNRNYAFAAKVPMLEPAEPQEARDFTIQAFQISEAFDTPVLLRTTTRLSHSKGAVKRSSEALPPPPAAGFTRDIKKYVMIPAYARPRHLAVEERMRRLGGEADRLAINVLELKDRGLGFITSGVCSTYVREVYPEASMLKLGMVYPLPETLIRRFAAEVKRIFVVEELDPFFELRIRAMGIAVEGKSLFPRFGELNPDLVAKPLEALGFSSARRRRPPLASEFPLPPRPPSLCPGCPHRTVFTILNRLKLTVTGDIGCYTLGALPPFASMDTCVEMGASIGVAQGIEAAMGDRYRHDVVAVIGDSTFAHSGVSGLMNAAYNGRRSLIVVLDNGTTAMTGLQPNPFSGQRIDGRTAPALDYRKLASAAGLADEQVRIVDAFKPKEVEAAIQELLASKRLALLVAKGECLLLKRRRRRGGA